MASFQNPVIPGFYPDPSICRAGEDYYLVTSTFEYFPGVPVFHSKDLVNWKKIGHCLTRNSQLDLKDSRSSGGIYAPTIRHHNGRFYMVTTNVSNGGNFYVWTDDPAGDWSEPIWVDQGGIDPSLLFDDDGTVYFTSNGSANPKHGTKKRGIYQCQINIETGERLTESKFLWEGTGERYPEAPHLYKIGNYYYLMIAEGGTEWSHRETIARSDNPYGPFESCGHNPILCNQSTYRDIHATGHGDLVEDHKGNWWMVFLTIRPRAYPGVHNLGRETALAPVMWDKNDWPVVNGDGTIDIEMDGPCLEMQPWDEPAVRDDFDDDELGLCWNFRFNEDKSLWSLSEKKGSLRLSCGRTCLSDTLPQAFIGQRQRHFDCIGHTIVDFTPKSENEEAGLTAIMNDSHHYEIFLTQREGKRVVVVRRQIGNMIKEETPVEAPDGPIKLEVMAEPDYYNFAWATEGKQPQSICKAQTRYLSKEVAGGFTGVYFGMYATANGKESENKAFFDWFDYSAR